MADLDPLIRYRKHQLDEKQKFLAKLYAEADRLVQQRKGILDQIEKEVDAMKQPDFEKYLAVSGFGEFLAASKKKIYVIGKEQQKMDVRIQIAVNDMRESFGELKKIEITQERRLEEEKKALQVKEDYLFEEIALRGYIDKSEL